MNGVVVNRHCRVLVNGLIISRNRRRKQSLIEGVFWHFKAISKRQTNISNSKDFSECKSFGNEGNGESSQMKLMCNRKYFFWENDIFFEMHFFRFRSKISFRNCLREINKYYISLEDMSLFDNEKKYIKNTHSEILSYRN